MAGGECEGGLTTLQEVCVGAALTTAALLFVGPTMKLRIRRETKFHQLPGIHKDSQGKRPPTRQVRPLPAPNSNRAESLLGVAD